LAVVIKSKTKKYTYQLLEQFQNPIEICRKRQNL